MRIDQIAEGDEIMTLDEATGRFVTSTVNKLMDMGIKTTFRLVTQDGREIRTTAEHPYLVERVDDLPIEHESPMVGAGWVKVQYLKPGMRIAVTGLPLRDTDAAFPDDDQLSDQTSLPQAGGPAAVHATPPNACATRPGRPRRRRRSVWMHSSARILITGYAEIVNISSLPKMLAA